MEIKKPRPFTLFYVRTKPKTVYLADLYGVYQHLFMGTSDTLVRVFNNRSEAMRDADQLSRESDAYTSYSVKKI